MKYKKRNIKSVELKKINALFSVNRLQKKEMLAKIDKNEDKVLFTLLWWSQPGVIALSIVVEKTQRIIESIKIDVKSGHSDRKIINNAKKYHIFSETDIEEMIMAIKKKKLRNILKNYHTLSDLKLGVTYNETFIFNNFRKDVSENLLMKIDIDYAIGQLDEFPILKQLLVMRFLEGISIDEIGNRYNFSKSKVYQLLDQAFERLVNLIEHGTSLTLKEIRINRLVVKLTESRVFDDSSWVEGIVRKMYKKAQKSGYI